MVCHSIYRVSSLSVPQLVGLSTAWALFHGPVIVCSHALPRMPPRVRFLPVFLDLASLLPGNLQKLETLEQPEFVADFGLHWPACYRIKLRYLANEEQSVHRRRDSAFADFHADPGHDRTTWTMDGGRLAVVVTNGGAALRSMLGGALRIPAAIPAGHIWTSSGRYRLSSDFLEWRRWKLKNAGLGLCLSYSFAERAQAFELRRDLGIFRPRGPLYNPSVFHSEPTRALVASSIRISSGHGRVKPSVAHFRVASMPIFDP
jgi:hypothetical protein